MKRYLLLSIAISGMSPAWAEEAPGTRTLTLAEAQATALKQHPKLLSSQYRSKASDEAVTEVRSAYFPQAGANAVRAFADDGTRLAASGGINNPTVFDRVSYGLNVTQLITDFGRTSHQVDAARAQAEAQAAKTLSAEDQILFDVTSAYYNVLRAQKIVEVAEATQKARSSLTEQISSLHEAKMKSDLDLSIAQQNVSAANLLALQAHNQLDDAEAMLAQAMGDTTTQHYVLQDETSATPLDNMLEPLLGQAKENNPELQALRAQRRAASEQAKAEEAAEYPTVSAVGYAGENPLRDKSQLDSNYAAAGITVSIPLFTGGRLTAAGNRTEYQARALEQDVLDKENQIARDVRLSWNNTQAAYQNISVSEELRKNSGEALELTQARYDIGKSSIVDLAQAQLSETQAEINSANAIYEYLIQKALLQYKAGGPRAH